MGAREVSQLLSLGLKAPSNCAKLRPADPTEAGTTVGRLPKIEVCAAPVDGRPSALERALIESQTRQAHRADRSRAARGEA
jgi:hypothetical protein